MKYFSWWVPKVLMYTTMHTFPIQSICQLTFNTAQGHIWLISTQCTWHFMGWLHGTVYIPGMKTGLWFGNFPDILSEIFVLNSTITVCHPLLYRTCCLNARERVGKVARVSSRVIAYNVPPNFHFVYIVFFVVYQLSFSTPHILHSWLAVCDHKWDQKFKSKMHSVV